MDRQTHYVIIGHFKSKPFSGSAFLWFIQYWFVPQHDLLVFRLHKTQDLLYESTKDFLELRYQGRANERQWMAEKDKLLREMDQCKSQLCISTKDSALDTSSVYDSKSSYIEEIKVNITVVKPMLSKHLREMQKWLLKTGACLIQSNFNGSNPFETMKIC